MTHTAVLLMALAFGAVVFVFALSACVAGSNRQSQWAIREWNERAERLRASTATSQATEQGGPASPAPSGTAGGVPA